MQHSPYELKDKLVRALDKDYNVVDMATVLEVITSLERAIITKETLEKTRIGKYINALRKRTHNEQLARRAKELVKSWRKLLPASSASINGEQVTRNVGTVLGPGPVFVPGPGPVDKVLKSSPPANERSASPICSSVSSSPQSTTSKLSASNRSTPSSYTPSKPGPTAIRNDKSCTESKIAISCQLFKPVSPALATVCASSNPNFAVTATDSLSQPKPQNLHSSPTLSMSSPSSSSLSNSSAMKSPTSFSQGQQKFEDSASPFTVVSLENAHSSVKVDKTNVANKRLRKMGKSRKKYVIPRSSTNGIALDSSAMVLRSVGSAFISLQHTKCGGIRVQPKSPLKVSKPKKSKRSLEPLTSHELFKEKLSCLAPGAKLKKVKTTQQLIEELQAKKGVTLNNSYSKKQEHDSEINNFLWKRSPHTKDSMPNDELLKSKSELMKKFLSSPESPAPVGSGSPVADRGSPLLSDNVPSKSSVIIPDKDFSASYVDPIDAEIEQILSSLPPIKPEEINLCDEEEPVVERKESFSDDDLDQMENGNWECVNGNTSADCSFKRWHECYEVEIKPGEVFRILPYVNID